MRCVLPVLLALIALPAWAGEGSWPPIDRKAWMVSSPSQRLRLLKPARYRPNSPDAADYMRLLERFPAFGERGWRGPFLGREEVGYFGDPDSAEMGMRSMGNFIFVTALLATDPAYDPRVTGVSAATLLQRCRACLRYMTRAHVTGDLTCDDGKQWGRHWQSAWWTAKMALGARLVWDRLPEDQRAAVRGVVTFEADRHLGRKPPGGALADTKSEENAWDTEVLAAGCAMFPDAPHAAAWRAKLIDFALNSLSAPQDRSSNALVDGRPLREQVTTTNINSDFTIENHGAYHACYMACPLHSLAWGAYAFQREGMEPPEAQFHHFRDVWRRLAPTFLEDRFAYIAGKDWPRYAYGLSFIMPALVTLSQRFGDEEARGIEAARFRAFEREQAANADGTFFGKRFTRNIMMDRLLEYETDAYANLGLCYLLRRGQAAPKPISQRELAGRLAGSHIGPEAHLATLRTPGLFAALAWKRLEGPGPSAWFIPAGCDDMAEWGPGNLVGRITAAGVSAKGAVLTSSDRLTPAGLECRGSVAYRKADGSPAYTLTVTYTVEAGSRCAEVRSRFAADADLEVRAVEGLRLHVANDFFNGGRRRWEWQGGRRTLVFDLRGPWPEKEALRTVAMPGRWVSLDGKVTITDLSPEPLGFALRVSDRRNGPWGSIHYDVLDCPPLREAPARYRKGDVILETAFRIEAGRRPEPARKE